MRLSGPLLHVAKSSRWTSWPLWSGMGYSFEGTETKAELGRDLNPETGLIEWRTIVQYPDGTVIPAWHGTAGVSFARAVSHIEGMEG